MQQLKVGELARSTGLTVRTLHHYDEIGLLKPSGRSDSGYRLYSREDVARLHGIQALRHLGLALNDIAALLDSGAPPLMILDQQMTALEREIAQATELRGRLALLRDGLRDGRKGGPEMGDWLQALSLMTTYGKYFSAAELKRIFAGWHRIERDWPALMKEVRALMDSGAPPQAPQAQGLARRWMALMHHWMDGDFELLKRWGEMYRQEPTAHGQRGGPPTDMVAYMQAACDLRLGILRRYFTVEELRRIRYVPEDEWSAIGVKAQACMDRGEPPASPAVRTLAQRWLRLLTSFVGGDTVLRDRLLAANRAEPLLEAGASLPPAQRRYLLQAIEGVDPHAT